MWKVSILILSVASMVMGFSPSTPSSIWVEDSMGVRFLFPRGWQKSVTRSKSNLEVRWVKNGQAILQLDVFSEYKDWDVDRLAEATLDRLLVSYPDLQVLKEADVGDSQKHGFDEAIFLVARYKENQIKVTNRFVFARKNKIYFIAQTKTGLKDFPHFKEEFSVFLKSMKAYDPIYTKGRNDSLNYLDDDKKSEIKEHLLSFEKENQSQEPLRSDVKRPIKDGLETIEDALPTATTPPLD